MSLDSLQSLFLEELKDIYHAEKQLVQALPRLAKAAGTPELQQAFSSHLTETEGHVERLERIFQDLGQAVGGKRCKGMEGLVGVRSRSWDRTRPSRVTASGARVTCLAAALGHPRSAPR
jgi:ferritin-like metal-binding protein YciE